MELLAVFVPPELFSVVLGVNVNGLGIPVVLLARHVVTAFEDQDSLSGGSQVIGKRAASGSRPDDDHVELISVGHRSLLRLVVHCGHGLS